MARRLITEDEKERARKRFGLTKECPRCRKSGGIDDDFGWRRLRPANDDVSPQAQCYACRSEYWAAKRR